MTCERLNINKLLTFILTHVLVYIINSISRTFVCVRPSLRLKTEPVAPDLESNVTTDIRPGVIRHDNAIGRALARYARGPGSNPGRDMLVFFALLVGFII